MINRISEEAISGVEAAEKCLQEKAAAMSAGLQRETKKWVSQLEHLIIENPALSLAVAVGIGLTVGCLLKRR